MDLIERNKEKLLSPVYDILVSFPMKHMEGKMSDEKSIKNLTEHGINSLPYGSVFYVKVYKNYISESGSHFFKEVYIEVFNDLKKAKEFAHQLNFDPK